jgi:hypothetical protein
MLAWGAMILVLIPLLGIALYALRYYQRRQREMQQRFAVDPTDDSAEPLNGMAERKSSPLRTDNTPWWHWHRWTGGDEEPHYFPLSDISERE